MKTADVIIDSAEKNVDLYYATKFSAPDPYMYFKAGNNRYIMIKDLEIDRAKATACVDKVLSLSKYQKRLSKKNPNSLDALALALKEVRVKKIRIPQTTGFVVANYLKKQGFRIEPGTFPFYINRLRKTPKELKNIIASQKIVFAAMKIAEDMLKRATVKKGVLYLKGSVLTSEIVRDAIRLFLYQKGYVADNGTIVACGKDSIDPHNFGSGPLRAHEAIIVDIFPKSEKTLFYGDATRTFCKGSAPDGLKKLYNTVLTAQRSAIGKIRAGINARTIHEGILRYFDAAGYPTGEIDGRMQGFFHSTGHGIGLELHEEPLRVGAVDFRLEKGHVTSVEPGLYYKKTGGVRIEDLVYVTENGCKVLAGYPKRLEV